MVAGGGHTIFFLNEQLGSTKNNRTTDGGDTSRPMGGTPQQTMSVFFTDPDTGYAVSYSAQTVRSVDGGETWENFLPEILNASVGDAVWVDGSIVIGCNNGDIFRAQVSCPNVAAVRQSRRRAGRCVPIPSGTAQWYLNDEPLPDGDTPCITASEPGNYHVIVTDGLGCVSAPSATVQVINTGIAPVSPSGARLLPNPAAEYCCALNAMMLHRWC